MSTKDEIIQLGDSLIREKGFNAFSFYDISKAMGIKNASIHYHFPSKQDLGIAVIRKHVEALQALVNATSDQTPLEKLQAFFSIYSRTKSENRVCVVGSLAPDLHTLEAPIQAELKILTTKILEWVTTILAEGESKGVFQFQSTPRTKALLIITNMLASLQLTRLTDDKDFDLIKFTIINELTP